MYYKYMAIVLFLYIVECKRLGVDNQCNGYPQMVTREGWRSREPRRQHRLFLPVSRVIIIHTAMAACDSIEKSIRQLQQIQDLHMDYRGFWDIAYNFLIDSRGTVYGGCGWYLEGSHSNHFNANALGIAFLGNYTELIPTKESLKAAQQLIKCGKLLGYITPSAVVHGHRDVSCTTSPGDNLYKEIRTWPNYVGGRISEYACTQWCHPRAPVGYTVPC